MEHLCVYLVVFDLSGCRESLLISISLIASFTSSFSTMSTIRRRACKPHTRTSISIDNVHESMTKKTPRCSTTASCAGTVRPRQVQCLMENPAIAQVSASQHQLLSLLVWCCFQLPPRALSTQACDRSRCSQFCMGLHSGE